MERDQPRRHYVSPGSSEPSSGGAVELPDDSSSRVPALLSWRWRLRRDGRPTLRPFRVGRTGGRLARSLDRPPGTLRRWWRRSHRPLPRRRAGVLTRTPPATGSRRVDESAVRDGIRFRGDVRWRETFLAESEIEIRDRDERDDDRGKGELDERRSELLGNGLVRRRDVDDHGNDDGRDDRPEHDEQLHQHESAEHGPPSPPDEIRRTSQRLSPGTPFENDYRHHDEPREPEIDARDDETNQSETRQHCDGDAGRDDGSGPGESDTDRPAPVCRAARGKICRRVHAGRLGEEAPEDEHGETDQLGGPRAPRRIQARRALLPPVPESRATDDERRDEDDSGRTDENAVVRQGEIDRARREFHRVFRPRTPVGVGGTDHDPGPYQVQGLGPPYAARQCG